MACYHVEVGYRTKRGGVAVGMTVKAFGPDEAEYFARDYVIGKHRARRWVFTDIREATETDIRIGVVNERSARATDQQGAEP
jgi:hypothetical protein